MDESKLFTKCIDVVLKNEGGYSNNPNDPGGSTNKGITQKVYDEYRLNNKLSIQSVRSITIEEVLDIYFILYWKPMHLDNINNDDLVLHLFDMGVNAGTKTSVKILQRLLKLPDDGIIGVITLKAIEDYKGNILEDFINKRKMFYLALVKIKPQLKCFLKGWLNRIDNTKFNEDN